MAATQPVVRQASRRANHSCSRKPLRKAQDSLSLFRLARPLLTQPRPFYGHRQVQVTREALHRADEVENVVLVPCRDQLAKQTILLTRLSPHLLCLGRVIPVLPVGPARPLQSLWRARSGTRSTVHAASPVWHRGPVTGAAVPTPCSAARGSVRTAETLAAERRLGFLGHFRPFPPAVPRPRAPRPTLPSASTLPPCNLRTVWRGRPHRVQEPWHWKSVE
jgi:hypothetical protein